MPKCPNCGFDGETLMGYCLLCRSDLTNTTEARSEEDSRSSSGYANGEKRCPKCKSKDRKTAPAEGITELPYDYCPHCGWTERPQWQIGNSHTEKIIRRSESEDGKQKGLTNGRQN